MERAKKQNLFFVTMTEYHPDIEAVVAFPPIKIVTTLATEISKAGLKQAHIAETEKYGHVTFFFNSSGQTAHEGENHYLIESRKDVPTHDFAPEMKAKEIADKAIERIHRRRLYCNELCQRRHGRPHGQQARDYYRCGNC